MKAFFERRGGGLGKMSSGHVGGLAQEPGRGTLPAGDKDAIVDVCIEGLQKVGKGLTPAFSAVAPTVRNLPSSGDVVVEKTLVVFAVFVAHYLLVDADPCREKARGRC